MWQNLKSDKKKLKLTKLKNSKCDNSKTEHVTKLKKWKCEKTQKFKCDQTKKKLASSKNEEKKKWDKKLKKLKMWQD